MGKIVLFLLLVVAFLFFENNYLVTDKKSFFTNGRVNETIKVLHLSDLHNKKIEHPLSKLSRNIKKNSPDLVVLTGDIITDGKAESLRYINYLAKIFANVPVYYVNGNHEVSDYGFKNEFDKAMKDVGFFCLDGIGKTVKIKGTTLYIAGLQDPLAYSNSNDDLIEKRIKELETSSGYFSILLSHRAEFTPLYNKSNFDLICAGHAHGGVIGVPFSKGNLYSRAEGFFPMYTKGLHHKTYISRGLGAIKYVPRIFNHPQASYLSLLP